MSRALFVIDYPSNILTSEGNKFFQVPKVNKNNILSIQQCKGFYLPIFYITIEHQGLALPKERDQFFLKFATTKTTPSRPVTI
jgi:hypothetical protein